MQVLPNKDSRHLENIRRLHGETNNGTQGFLKKDGKSFSRNNVFAVCAVIRRERKRFGPAGTHERSEALHFRRQFSRIKKG